MSDTIETLRRLHAEATQGEWDYVDSVVWIATHDSHGEPVQQKVADTGDEADATLIVAMHAALPKLLEIAGACGELLKAIDAGRMRQTVGVTGQTIDAQLRASVYDRVPAWPVELAREKYALALASLKEPA